mmetsp:Transcript_95109/g.272017  ORF Transcript_95109/g.272017 Transcript_95109/m.272017 type:complete len:228 (-) Transcript_95109:481-1164(-)
MQLIRDGVGVLAREDEDHEEAVDAENEQDGAVERQVRERVVCRGEERAAVYFVPAVPKMPQDEACNRADKCQESQHELSCRRPRSRERDVKRLGVPRAFARGVVVVHVHLHWRKRLGFLVLALLSRATHVIVRCAPLLEVRPAGEGLLHRRDSVQCANVHRGLEVRRQVALLHKFLELPDVQVELSAAARTWIVKSEPDIGGVGWVHGSVVLRELHAFVQGLVRHHA